jgi:hypothetical protein
MTRLRQVLGTAGEGRRNAFYVPDLDESRHIQIQRTIAMTSATQLSPSGIW